MSANGNATTPVGVLDADGYAICPDCLTRINCGSVGLPNLELRHRGKKVCQSNREKRDKAAKKTKNQSILSFAIRPKAQPVPSTVITAPVVQGEKLAPVVLSSITLPLPSKESSSDLTTTGHNLDNSDFLVRFFDTIRRLPSDVPEGKEYDILAIFAGDPAQHDNPSLTADDLWETSLNSLLKSTLGWGTEGDMDNVIRRGRMGLDGLYEPYLLRILTSEKMAASGPAISDVAVQEIPAVVLVGEPAAMPPLAQEDNLACVKAMNSRSQKENLRTVHTHLLFTTFSRFLGHMKCPGMEGWHYALSDVVECWILELRVDWRKEHIPIQHSHTMASVASLRCHVKALDNHKRLLMAIASGKVVRIAQLISIGLRQKKGVLALLESVINAAQGWYRPNGFTEEEDMKGLLFLRLGSNRLRRRSTVPPLTPSHAQPTIEQVKKNLEATVESILDVVQNRFQLGSTLHTVLMFDEIATEKRIRWDPKTNHLLGVWKNSSGA